MAKYLLETGTEELPYKFISSAMSQLKQALAESLKNNRIEFKDIKTYGTPRRLAVIIEDISESQPDIVKKIKGPPVKVVYDDKGKLTQAGLGFVKKQGINPEILFKEAVGGVEYVFADVKEYGKKTGNVLQQIIPDLMFKLHGSHFMRWADLDTKFSRPVRWLVSLMDNEEVKINIADVESTKFSRGHRFYGCKEVEITSPDSYIDDLYRANVIVDQEKRRLEIIKQAENIAQTVGGKAHLDLSLVEEVTYILEWPVAVLGSFDEKYLAVPKEVIVTVMASHQRYFPVFSGDNNDLLNYFITMSNYDAKNSDNIKKGNERVIKARLDDAIFFYKEDIKRTLESRVEDLKGVTFQKGLGTVYDKVGRIREISYFICEELGLSKNIVDDVERTALLSKADLVTSLVREFTELQGVIGSQYARLNGENNSVTEGIKEHYYPVSADGELAESITGQIVSISDKIDTICGVFALGKAPTGSADPLGLRRAALGIILTLLKKDININISKIIGNAISVQPAKINDKAALTGEIRDFITQRLRIYLNETYRYDVVEAVLGVKDPLADLKDLMNRIEALSNLVKGENYDAFHDAINRINRIIRLEKLNSATNPSLFIQDAERQLWNCFSSIEQHKVDYNRLLKELEGCIPAIEKFFEDVLVMDPDQAIRQNRISLLKDAESKFLNLADFSKIVA